MFIEKMATFFDTNILKKDIKIKYKRTYDDLEHIGIITYINETILYVMEIPYEWEDDITIYDVLDGTVKLEILEDNYYDS